MRARRTHRWRQGETGPASRAPRRRTPVRGSSGQLGEVRGVRENRSRARPGTRGRTARDGCSPGSSRPAVCFTAAVRARSASSRRTSAGTGASESGLSVRACKGVVAWSSSSHPRGLQEQIDVITRATRRGRTVRRPDGKPQALASAETRGAPCASELAMDAGGTRIRMGSPKARLTPRWRLRARKSASAWAFFERGAG